MTSAIRELNDAFRTAGFAQDWYLTEGVSSKGLAFSAAAVNAVRRFTAFTEDNDPCGEHDFGCVQVQNLTLFWKIDYYDQSLEAGSEDPADSLLTRRVMTIMLASEY